jgi:hypothetical protein
MGMSRQLDRSAFRTAELEIEAGCILLSALLDQGRHPTAPPG